MKVRFAQIADDLHVLARRVAPELSAAPLYLVSDADASFALPPDVLATACNGPCALAQKRLRADGKWQGPGPLVVFRDVLRQRKTFVELLLHELGHVLPASPVAAEPLTTATLAASREEMNQFLATHDARSAGQPRWAPGHDRAFHRRCAHLWWRAALTGEVVSFNWFGGRHYDLSPGILYWQSLESEGVRLSGASFAEIMAAPEPDLFRQFWMDDLAYFIRNNPTTKAKFKCETSPPAGN